MCQGSCLEQSPCLTAVYDSRQPAAWIRLLQRHTILVAVSYIDCSKVPMALFTPDDLVEKGDGSYLQSRPNTLFELGWFAGRLGRSRVCILSKDGTKLPTDLDGIRHIRFKESVTEQVIEIRTELQAAGLVAGEPQKRSG